MTTGLMVTLSKEKAPAVAGTLSCGLGLDGDFVNLVVDHVQVAEADISIVGLARNVIRIGTRLSVDVFGHGVAGRYFVGSHFLSFRSMA